MSESKEAPSQEQRLVVTYQDGTREIYEDYSKFLSASSLKNTNVIHKRPLDLQTDELLLLGIDI